MGKNRGTAADPSVERMNYLHQLSLQCATRLTSADGDDGGLGRYLAHTMAKGVAKRSVNRVGTRVKRLVCRKCSRFLRASWFRLRLKARPPHVMVRCRGCHFIMRRPIAPAK